MFRKKIQRDFKSVINFNYENFQIVDIVFNEECHAAIAKQTCSCFLSTGKICNLFYLAAKMSQYVAFNPVFKSHTKMGSAIFVPFVS